MTWLLGKIGTIILYVMAILVSISIVLTPVVLYVLIPALLVCLLIAITILSGCDAVVPSSPETTAPSPETTSPTVPTTEPDPTRIAKDAYNGSDYVSQKNYGVTEKTSL